MVKKHTTDVDIQQLELELANLRVVVSDKEQQLAEARLERAIDRQTVHHQSDNNGCSRSCAFCPSTNTPSPVTSSPPPRAVNTFWASTKTLTNSDHSLVPTFTGFKDCNRQKIYIDDIATLNKDSTGNFAPFFRQGSRVRITGVTDNCLLYCQSLEHPLQTTTRASRNLTKVSGGNIYL